MLKKTVLIEELVFYIKFNGIEKIYSAHRDTGHGYGIEIKIK